MLLAIGLMVASLELTLILVIIITTTKMIHYLVDYIYDQVFEKLCAKLPLLKAEYDSQKQTTQQQQTTV